eukprot:CAMPEP_0169119528 /NCGR_PEP_ID=MMETSP1015-20121227/31609_1 /TAXON_ID=342587 /ORGANISM="Karlodinium micrum, Strain CCMP2283" /LENGTH=124 /DNA_ID=CAMNT_0009182423 /DNA_START=193 /DNA_END=567 /DNA_ORIENTATION=+
MILEFTPCIPLTISRLALFAIVGIPHFVPSGHACLIPHLGSLLSVMDLKFPPGVQLAIPSLALFGAMAALTSSPIGLIIFIPASLLCRNPPIYPSSLSFTGKVEISEFMCCVPHSIVSFSLLPV